MASDALLGGDSMAGTTRGAGPLRLRRPRATRAETAGALTLTAPYLVVLLLVGATPVAYALQQSLVSSVSGGFVGFANFSTVFQNFAFGTSFLDVATLLAVWLPMMVVGVVTLALLIDATRGWFGRLVMFIYYIPGALAGMTNLVLWLLLLDPTVSPAKFLLHAIGAQNLDDILASPTRVIVVLAIMLFFQGAGSWIVIMYGGLNSIPDDVQDQARIDGCDNWKLAWHVKLPIVRPWIGYLVLMNFAYGFQIFLEPQVLSTAAQGLISPQWSPNQLSYTYAYSVGNIGAAAALSVILLVITLALGVITVTKTGLLERS